MLDIKKYGDPILRQKCKEIKDIESDTIKKLTEDMKTTMYNASGVGIAATQVGVDKQVFIADIGKGALTILNPKIIKKSKDKKHDIEGCLSIPGFNFSVGRAHSIELQGYLLEKAEKVSIKADGLLARVFQHEIDHLNGKLIIDHAPFIQRRKALKKLRKKVRA